ncbi:RluA family pseudouridine synthase [Paenibacillus spongiae]|uniref:Pseudouridine synthase n=1 Tax=Paenibacillus spongiae TaxID=2909671 RepID=A0ABY5S4U2_9BACL|nr:RluA family pseudouridine synthase [Paenibacillus spongiae]UVI28694.1 RluA family pseudouridine synthase [Paenibacillus spongiae]
MKYYEPLAVHVKPEEDGMTVRKVLERNLGVSRKLLSRLKLTDEGITVNGCRVYTSSRVKQGDCIELRMEQERSDDILPEAIPLDIVYEDRDLLILNKPPGIVVHPTHGHYTGTLANGVVHHWQQRGELVRFRPIHRLDQDTSGLLAIAKNPYIHQQLSEQMHAGDVYKSYLAYVYNAPVDVKGTVDAPIDRDPDSPHVRTVLASGYPSVTHYETAAIYRGGEAAKVKLKLETGRTHQIRVHMKHIGCPLIGDGLYGYAGNPADGGSQELEAAVSRQALHAAVLGMTHPISRKWLEWEAPLPEDLRKLEAMLKATNE